MKAVGHIVVKNLFVAPESWVAADDPSPDGNRNALLNVTGMVCGL